MQSGETSSLASSHKKQKRKRLKSEARSSVPYQWLPSLIIHLHAESQAENCLFKWQAQKSSGGFRPITSFSRRRQRLCPLLNRCELCRITEPSCLLAVPSDLCRSISRTIYRRFRYTRRWNTIPWIDSVKCHTQKSGMRGGRGSHCLVLFDQAHCKHERTFPSLVFCPAEGSANGPRHRAQNLS